MTSLFPRLAFASLMIATTVANAAAQGVSSNVTRSAPGAGGLPGGVNQQSIKGMNPAPTATIGGTPVVVNSPVIPPYNADSTYSTYQGQPASGPSAMLAASAQGAP